MVVHSLMSLGQGQAQAQAQAHNHQPVGLLFILFCYVMYYFLRRFFGYFFRGGGVVFKWFTFRLLLKLLVDCLIFSFLVQNNI